MRYPLIATTLATLVTLTSCGSPAANPGKPGGMPPAPPVGVATPIARELPVIRELTGRIEAIESVEIRPRVSGQITAVLTTDGAEVKAGDPLFTIDDAPLHATADKFQADITKNQSEIERAEADIARAESLLSQATSTRDRNLKLVGERIISQQQFDDSAAAVESAKAALNATKAARASALAGLSASRAALVSTTLDLDHTRMTAPIAGRISRILTTVGNQVQGGGPAPATLMTTLVKVDPLYAVFDLDEQTFHTIGARLRESAKGGTPVPVRVSMAGETDFSHTGAVSFVDNQIDATSGAIRIRATLTNADHALTPGAFIRVQLETAPPRQVLLVHERAVLSQLATRYVLTVDDHGVTAFRPVTLGDKLGSLRIVEKGLAPTDRIAVNNLAKVFFPGMPIAPVPAAMETSENLQAPEASGAPATKPTATEGSKP